MTVLKLKEDKPTNPVFRLPVDTSTGPTALIRSEYIKEQDSMLYPLVSDIPQEEVDAYLNSGIIGPLQAKAEALTAEKRTEVITSTIETSRIDQKTPEEAIAELEALRDTNPFLKAYVSPSVVEALKQSDNALARSVAQGKLANVAIAAQILNDKMVESSEESFWTNFDFVDVLVSDLPVVSMLNVERRKELRDRFIQILDSNDDPASIKTELQAIVDEAADMGLFTDSNRFYMMDFLNLTLEEGKGGELALQQALGVLDTVAFLPALADTGKLIAFTRGSSKEAAAALERGIIKDDPFTGAVDPATWKESAITPERMGPRSPTEATAVKEVEAGIKAREEALRVRMASGQFIDDETFVVLQNTIKEEILKREKDAGNLRAIDVNVRKDPVMENIYAEEFYGTTKGKAFTSWDAASIYANQIGGAEVVDKAGNVVSVRPVKVPKTTSKTTSKTTITINGKTTTTTSTVEPNVLYPESTPKEAPTEFLVRKTRNVPTGWYTQGASPEAMAKDMALYTPLDVDRMGTGFFAKYGSGLSQTDETQNALVKQMEASMDLSMDIIAKDFEAQLKLIGKEGRAGVSKVLTELRDGSLAGLRKSPTVAEFDDYFFQFNKRRATPDELKAYQIIQEWNDTDWFFSADIHFKRAVNRGIEILIPQDGLEVAATKTTKGAQAGRTAWDADAGKYVSVDTLDDKSVIYRLGEPMEFGGKMNDLVVSKTPKTRALRHSDVMGYNVGGSRLYEHNVSNRFVKQETEVTLADGTVRPGTPRTIMAVKTEAEGNKAVTEINNILSKLHTIADPKAFTKLDDYLEVIKTKYKDPELQDTIAKNSGWNTDVHSVETLVEFARENRFDLRKLVSHVGDGEAIRAADAMIGDITFGDVARSPGLLKYGDFRKDNVLMGYGGKALPTIDPLEAIGRSLMSSVASQAELAYETRAIMRLYKSALTMGPMVNGKPSSLIKNADVIRNMSLRMKARHMQIDTSTEVGQKLELERQKILQRLEQGRMLDISYNNAKDRFANVLYDKGYKKFAEKIDANSVDPDAARAGIVFDAVFWGTFEQVWVQGSQIASIAAIADKFLGYKAVLAAPVFRGILRNGHRPVDEAATALLAKVLQIEPKQMLDILDNYRASGRWSVKASVADLGPGTNKPMRMSKVRQAGRVFYHEGELLSRSSAWIAASLEYIAKNGPKADLNSQAARRWVMHRQDTLTHAMTTKSKHPIMQLATFQFQQYALNFTESLVTGLKPGTKGMLTNKEKFKLASMQLFLYGAVAVPFVGAGLEYYEWKYGTGLDEPTYNLLRKGALDALLEYMTGIETEAGGRLAWGEGMFNTIQDFQDKNLIGLLLGATGTVGTNLMESVNQFVGNLKYGSMRMTGEDLMEVAKVMKFANMYDNARLAFMYGQYQGRNSGEVMADDFTAAEAMAVALGVPMEKVNGIWDTIKRSKQDTEHYKSVGEKISRLYNDLHFEVLANGWDSPHTRTLAMAIEAEYALYANEMYKIERFIDKKFITMAEEAYITNLRREAEKKIAAQEEGNQ